jgi:excisionase family DNA binding protein
MTKKDDTDTIAAAPGLPAEWLVVVNKLVAAAVDQVTRKLAKQPLLPEKIYLDDKQACAFLGLSQPGLYKHVREKRLPAYRFGGSVRYKVSDLCRLVEHGTAAP